MNYLNWLLRAKRWAQNPPSAKRVMLILAIVGACAVLYGLERMGLLPDWMQAERIGRNALRF